MSQSAKMMLFAAVLTVGICAASLFRKPPGAVIDSASQGAAPAASATFTHRLDGPKVVVGPTFAETAPPHLAESTPRRSKSPRAAIGAGGSANTPPELPEASPIGSFPLGAPPAWPVDEPRGEFAGAANGGRMRHRVEDGDTLASLAQQHLGDANRAAEILEANRDALPPSGALPIGVDLVIPPLRGSRGVPAQATSLSNVGDDAPRLLPISEQHAPSRQSAAPLEDNPVAPGVIRPASEPLP